MRATLDRIEMRESIVLENEGQKIFGILHRPLLVDNPPVVVILHGFASSKLGSNRCYVTLSESLAKQGIASVRFDFRGSGDSEGYLSDISFENLVSDAELVLESIADIEGIDASRIAIFGASLGGALGLIAGARFAQVKTMALWASVASGELWYRDFLRSHPEYMNVEPAKVMTSYRGVKISEAFKTEFQRMFAYKALMELSDVPVLMMHGEKDSVVTIAHHEAFKKASQSLPHQHRFVTYADAEHSLGFSPYFPQVIEETHQWFKQHL